jgi:hypothetical protein
VSGRAIRRGRSNGDNFDFGLTPEDLNLLRAAMALRRAVVVENAGG